MSPTSTGQGFEGISLTEMLQGCFACGVITVDGRGEIAALTPLASRILDHDRIADKPARSLPPAFQELLDEIRKTGRPVTDREIVFNDPGFATIVLSVTATPLTAGPKTGGAVLVFRDLSAMQRLEGHLQWLDRLASIGTLSASMAHEIKNALVPIKTFVGLILEKHPETELAGTVRREMNRVDAIVGRVLRFSAPGKPTFAPVRLHDLLEHSLHLVQHRVEGKHLTFERRFNASPDVCQGDNYQLEQAFVNLLFNAVEAMGSGGRLTVSTERMPAVPGSQPPKAGADQKFVQIEIQDTGMGIAPEHLGAIFEPFFTTKPDGTGLGLAVTRRVIEEHNGVIQVNSRKGHGTTFSVYLPSSA